MSISLILAESALEMVPRRIWGHPSVKSHARRTGVSPSEMLLDVSWHYSAMKKLPHAEKRGRPDLVHLAVVAAASTPLHLAGGMPGIYVHTFDDYVVRFGPGVRVPKSYHRFAGLVRALYGQRGAGMESGKGGEKAGAGGIDGRERPLADVSKMSLGGLIREKKFDRVIGLSSAGDLPGAGNPYRAVARRLWGGGGLAGSDNAATAVVVGGFQKGHFSGETAKFLDEVYAVGSEPLEAHVVIARLLYECEKKPFM